MWAVKSTAFNLNTKESSFYIKKRANARVHVLLMAAFKLKDKGAQEQDCVITNVSVSGAGITFPRIEGAMIVNGAIVQLKILIPRTVLHVSVQGEIMWAKQRTKDILAGVRFLDMISESMFQQFQKKTDKV